MVKWVIIVQKFKEISWNIKKKPELVFKKLWVIFMQVKYGQILIKTYPFFA